MIPSPKVRVWTYIGPKRARFVLSPLADFGDLRIMTAGAAAEEFVVEVAQATLAVGSLTLSPA